MSSIEYWRRRLPKEMRPSLQSDQPCSHTHLTRARCHSLLARCAVTNPSTASRRDADAVRPWPKGLGSGSRDLLTARSAAGSLVWITASPCVIPAHRSQIGCLAQNASPKPVALRARKYCAASALKGAMCFAQELEDFIDRHVGPDRQLTLRLALT